MSFNFGEAVEEFAEYDTVKTNQIVSANKEVIGDITSYIFRHSFAKGVTVTYLGISEYGDESFSIKVDMEVPK
jgi:curli biogenesis system outer membrane secretion channel CsgG